MGYIYKITNKINNKIYIGKTTRNPEVRWKEHIRDSKNNNNNNNNNNNIPLYNAFNKYGIDNFSFEVISEEKNEKLNEKEKKYIQLYNSFSRQNGYNITDGGDGGKTFSKLQDYQVKEIINILQDENNFQSFEEIGKLYKIDKSVISRINSGETWYNSKINYPIRKYNVTGISISKEKYKNIVEDIQNSSQTLLEIRNKYNLSEEQMTNINNGKYCYSKNNLYYQGIYNGDFPIRKNNQKINFEDKEIKNILYQLIFTNNSCAKIGEQYNIHGVTINYINNGKRRKELTKEFIIPIRQNKEKNKEIYKKIYN